MAATPSPPEPGSRGATDPPEGSWRTHRPRFTRRGMLGMSAGATLLASAGCSTPEAPQRPTTRDPLLDPLAAARSDAATADSAAKRFPDLAPAAGSFAMHRRAHADALRAEIHRRRNEFASASALASPSTTPESGRGSATTAAPSHAFDSADAARSALRAAAISARKQCGMLAVKLPAQRAGMVASIAASCAQHERRLQ